ncbi:MULTISPECIES: hypothetical protein [unclassified Bradyrhizobium]|uniref:hypothetical protein n=1 Tax=unclassified Bradyrhizobium TaxID=2631580 RepID=UPI00247AAD1B|nr:MULTISPECIES: hypothetical protein [unclassified Bradyrhizobium]WGS23104.1 hypothetical protein MTX22_16565 [Bradyrhizobium sp. ISRA463]WGS30107.1 hypothetical protein MTX19_14295 [Bradyrhizobium sp. ISRA464]
MKRLILTGWLTPEFTKSGFADLAVDFTFRFVWGPLPSPGELAAYLGARTPDLRPGFHWSDFASRWNERNESARNLSLASACQQYETVELWFDMDPKAQLQLVWLLDYFRSHPQAATKLRLCLVDSEMIGLRPGALDNWRPPVVDVTEIELATARAAWHAYRAATPEGCFDLLGRDLSALPLLKPALIDLLAELPSPSTGLGATEMRMLEMVARGYSLTNALFYLESLRQTRIFNENELGYLLDGLALGSRPAVAGLDDELRTLDRDALRARLFAYRRSELSLTKFGQRVIAHKEDFSSHNPIDRWWGGTHLTNDNLWRWAPTLIKP